MSIFSKILGQDKNPKDSSKNDKLLEKIQKMDLADMRLYVNGKLNDFQVSNYGLYQIIKRFIIPNENTSNMYILPDDMDSKKKKVFDLVVLILSSKEISINTVELIQKFLITYSEIIKKYDKDNKQIYEDKIKEHISLAADKISYKSEVANKMRTLN